MRRGSRGSVGGLTILFGFNSLVHLSLALVLLLAGLACWRRRPSTFWLHLIYAIASIAWVVSYQVLYPRAFPRDPSLGLQYTVTMWLGLLPGLAQWVFYIAWFAQARIRREIATWRP